MPPCLDVYVRVHPSDRAAMLSRFINRYVDTENPGDPRFDAFVRTFIAGEPAPGDPDALAELRRDFCIKRAFSLYLRASDYYQAIITLTEENDLVFGLSMDDPDNDPAILPQASALMASLAEEFGATTGVAGVELPPPQSSSEWTSDALVTLRYESG
ncbi:hypothetical protein [Nocardia sp. NBC_01329]|uniref:hypothetical protein n=1 Tax=Nocardia sp. NBC_01329 TaxID=2903594 RepID=UPI002E0DD36F|nr:hypothetical protein OG405_16500 [Nocardia sp. NBC_01329]